MNYRLALVEREGLVGKSLVVIVGVDAGQERCAGAIPNFASNVPTSWHFFLSVEIDKQKVWYAT